MRRLWESQAIIEAKDSDERSSLHTAIAYETLENVRLLLELKANIETRALANDWTALLLACTSSKVECSRILLVGNVDVEAKENDGCTALNNGVYVGSTGLTCTQILLNVIELRYIWLLSCNGKRRLHCL